MKLVVAIIKPFKISEVKNALSEIGITRMTVAEVKGFGRQRGHAELYRGTEYQIDFVPKLRMEIAVDDDDLDQVLDTLSKASRTDTIGDGKIFVLPLEEAIRIRTGEQGPDAL
jgi:nitrogen regulatory protein P-II 2